MEGGVPQEPPSTCPTLETTEELNVEIDIVPKEPVSTLEQGTTQAEVSTRSRDVADRGRESKTTTRAGIDQVGEFFQFSSYFSLPKGARVSHSTWHIGEEVAVPLILKYDELKKGPATTGLLATRPRTEEEVDVSEIREPKRRNLVEPPMDVHRVSLPHVEISSQQGKVGDSKEMAAP